MVSRNPIIPYCPTIAKFERLCARHGLCFARRGFHTFRALKRFPFVETVPTAGLREFFRPMRLRARGFLGAFERPGRWRIANSLCPHHAPGRERLWAVMSVVPLAGRDAFNVKIFDQNSNTERKPSACWVCR
jgi:hypothetical protein